MKKILDLRKQLNCAALIQNPKNRRYLTGFSSSDGMVLICDKVYLLLDFRYTESAIIKQKNGEIPSEIQIICPEKSFLETVAQLLEENGESVLAFEEDYVSYKAFETLRYKLDKIKLVAMGGIVEKLRQQKSPSELEKIKAAQKITDDAFEHILNFINPSRTEIEIAAEIDCFFRKNGAYPAFDTICVSGKNSSLPHGVPQDIPLTKNSFLTMDFGACLDGYCSDMTRTVVVGKADQKMKQVYSTVLKAQNAVFSVLKGNMQGDAVDAVARNIIYNCGYKGCFGHSLGHSLGLDIHEAPNFSPTNHGIVPSGCVLSVEPGIYINGMYGVRIEDIVYLTDSGFINLTASKKDLIEL